MGHTRFLSKPAPGHKGTVGRSSRKLSKAILICGRLPTSPRQQVDASRRASCRYIKLGRRAAGPGSKTARFPNVGFRYAPPRCSQRHLPSNISPGIAYCQHCNNEGIDPTSIVTERISRLEHPRFATSHEDTSLRKRRTQRYANWRLQILIHGGTRAYLTRT
ncbi:hypothetical protein BDV95DRAFT_266274 [Massariosphaeria phaeospora]|uniref:Uncharacterized protein n=1 Tax=Massariosphaeria phaeospora TaxID=100035 RepID=A0A7C8M6E7_9PLEO|nr:hypothetical protein BDV95DRAFT_266274 [Massariosphaeria phaeospora]